MIDSMMPETSVRDRLKDIREMATVAASLIWVATALVVFAGAVRVVWRIW